MTVLISLLGLSVWAVSATVVAVARDGYRAVPTQLDPNRFDYESSRSA